MTPPTPALRVHAFSPGPYQTNCYVLSLPGSRACWIIDAGFEPQHLIRHIQTQGLTPEALLLTHAHVDHIAGVPAVRRAFPGIPVRLHEAEKDWLSDPELNLSIFTGEPVSMPAPDGLLLDLDELRLGPLSFRVLHTPGHSPGGVAFWCESQAVAFSGDSLFAGSVGRTDFPGCSFETLERSIRTRLYTLPDATRIFPGHGDATTIAHERRTNPFVGDGARPGVR